MTSQNTEQDLLKQIKEIQQKLSAVPGVEQLTELITVQSAMLALERRRLDWIQRNMIRLSFSNGLFQVVLPALNWVIRYSHSPTLTTVVDAGIEADGKKTA